MKKLLRFLGGFLLCGLVLAVGGALALSLYYRNSFPVSTWINGIYCTGKSVEQVNEELISHEEASVITVTGADGVSGTIHTSAAGIYPNYTDTLKKYLKQHATAFWMKGLQEPTSLELAAERFSWNEGKLEFVFETLPFVAQELEKQEGVTVYYDEEKGYCLKDGNLRRLNTDKAFEYLKECLENGETSVNFLTGGCYENVEDTIEDREKRELWQKLVAFTDCGIVYDMGTERLPLTPDITGSFLERDALTGEPSLDEKGNPILSEAAVRSWVEKLAAAYDTCGTEREFQSTRGDCVTVKYGTYGTELDVEAEVAYLVKAMQISRSEAEVHIPVYKQQGYVRGLDDIGDTYIEVDMTEQHMYLYLDGELVLDTDVVTGDVAKKRETPEGIYYLYGKQRDRILRGGDYATPVKYWMPVVGGVGIHDAAWRKKFGGEIYKTNGSHGCINTPLDIVSQMYEMVEVGIPVVMFY